MTKQEDSTTAGIYQKIFHHDVLAGRCGALQMQMKMNMNKLAVFIIENFLDDEDGEFEDCELTFFHVHFHVPAKTS